MRNLLPFIFLAISFAAGAQQAPEVQWDRCILNASIKSSAKLDESTFVLAYETHDCIDSSAFGLRAYNTNGDSLWDKFFSPPTGQSYQVWSVTKASDGLLISGSIDSFGISSNRIIKTDNAGNVLWDQKYLFDDTAKVHFCKTIEASDGTLVFVGESYSDDLRDLLLLKLDEQGNITGQKTYGGSLYEYAADVIETSDGDFLVAAFTNSTNKDVSSNNGNMDVWIIKTNDNGSIIWEKSFGGSRNEEACSILETSDGYLIAGVAQSSDSGAALHHGGNDYYDYWVFEIDSNGNLLWNKQYGGIGHEFASQMISSKANEFVISGNAYSVESDVTDHHGSSLYNDQWTIGIDGDGEVIWSKSTGGSHDDWSNCIVALDSINFIVAGGSISSDGDNLTSCFTNNCGVINGGWTVKIGSTCGVFATSDFSFIQDGNEFSFINESLNAFSWFWDFGDGATSTQPNPVHEYAEAGIYVVCMTATGECSANTFCDTIQTCIGFPEAGFGISYPGGTTVNFSDISVNDVEWHWDFGDGETSTLENPQHTYAINGTYDVTLTIFDSCGNSSTKVKEVNTCSGFIVDFSYTANGNIISFSDLTQGLPTEWFWDFGDGNTSTQQNPVYEYAEGGMYEVCLSAGNDSCGTLSVCQFIEVFCPPFDAAFSFTQSSDTVAFFDQSVNSISWQWDFGDGNSSSSQNPVHEYDDFGTYYVCLITSDGCSLDTLCDSVTVVAVGTETGNSDEFYLSVYPNPAHEKATIGFYLPVNSIISIFIYDAAGKEIYRSQEAETSAGNHSLTLKTEMLPPGTYLLYFTSEKFATVKKLMVE